MTSSVIWKYCAQMRSQGKDVGNRQKPWTRAQKSAGHLGSVSGRENQETEIVLPLNHTIARDCHGHKVFVNFKIFRWSARRDTKIACSNSEPTSAGLTTTSTCKAASSLVRRDFCFVLCRVPGIPRPVSAQPEVFTVLKTESVFEVHTQRASART